MQIILRKQAKEFGLLRYFTGKPCKHGHVAERRTDNRCCCECKLEYNKEWREENPAYDKKWRDENPSYKKEWNTANPESRRSYNHKRRSKTKVGEPSSVIAAWAQSQTKVCYWCNKNCKKDYHIDHYIPLSKGGKHEINNLRISCQRCNMTKNAKDPYDFAKKMGKLF